MPWNDDLPTAAEWDTSLTGARDTFTDSYRTTYYVTSAASVAQEAGTRVGILALADIRTTLVTYDGVPKDQLRQRITAIDGVLARCGTVTAMYDAYVAKGVYIFNEAKRALVTALVATGNAKKAYLTAIADYVEQPLPTIEELVTRRYTLEAHGGQHEIGLDPHYWIEQTHPVHGTSQVSRSLGTLFGQWQTAAEQGTTNQPFYVWIECNDRLATIGDPRIVVEYLQASDVSAYELHVNAGRVQRARSRDDRRLANYDTTGFDDDNMAAFVIAPDRKVYSHQHQRGVFHHSSFLAGGKVLCAGLMSVQSGVVSVVTPKSGHYKATMKDFLAGLLLLEQAGIIGDGVLVDLEFWKNKYVQNVPVDQLRDVLDPRGKLRLPLAAFRHWATAEVANATRAAAVWAQQQSARHQESLTKVVSYTLILKKFHPRLFDAITREVARRNAVHVSEAAVTNSAEWMIASNDALHPLQPELAKQVLRSMINKR